MFSKNIYFWIQELHMWRTWGGLFFSLGRGMLSQTVLLIVATMHVMLSSLKKITVYLVMQFNNTDHFTVAQKYASTAVVLELIFILYLYHFSIL